MRDSTQLQGERRPWFLSFHSHAKNALRAMRNPFERRCPRCGSEMKVVSETSSTITPTVIMWRKEMECRACGHTDGQQVIEEFAESWWQ